jgi:hypothetical protein
MNGEGPPGGVWGEAMVGHVWTPHSLPAGSIFLTSCAKSFRARFTLKSRKE